MIELLNSLIKRLWPAPVEAHRKRALEWLKSYWSDQSLKGLVLVGCLALTACSSTPPSIPTSCEEAYSQNKHLKEELAKCAELVNECQGLLQ